MCADGIVAKREHFNEGGEKGELVPFSATSWKGLLVCDWSGLKELFNHLTQKVVYILQKLSIIISWEGDVQKISEEQLKKEYDQSERALESILLRRSEDTVAILKFNIHRLKMVLKDLEKDWSTEINNEIQNFVDDFESFEKELQKSFKEKKGIPEKDVLNQMKPIFEKTKEAIKFFKTSCLPLLDGKLFTSARRGLRGQLTTFVETANAQQKIYGKVSSDPYLNSLKKNRDEALKRLQEFSPKEDFVSSWDLS